MGSRSLRQWAADTPLADWIVEYGEAHGWTSGRQAARYLKVKQAAFSTWLRGEVEPGRDNQEQLAASTGLPVEFFADLVRRTKAHKQRAAVPPATTPPATIELPARELIRLTVMEMLDQMSRRGDPVPPGKPHDDPMARQIVADLAAALEGLPLELIEEARRCALDVAARHRRTVNELSSQGS